MEVWKYILEKKWQIVSIVLSILLVASIVLGIRNGIQLQQTRRELEQSRDRVEQLERELDRSSNQLFTIEQSIGRCVSIVGESEEILSKSRDTIDGVIETARELRESYEDLAKQLLDLYRGFDSGDSNSSEDDI